MLPQKAGINPNGCGIGLTVSKKWIEALGGSINLVSEPGEGTIVTFEIPLIESPDSEMMQVLRMESDQVDELEVDVENAPVTIEDYAKYF